MEKKTSALTRAKDDKNSISRPAKDEVLRVGQQSDCCRMAFLSAVLHTAGSLLISDGRLSAIVKSNIPRLKKSIDSVLGELYDLSSVLVGSKITIRGENMPNILCDCGILRAVDTIEIITGIDAALVSNDCCAAAYVRGAFVGCGSVSALKNGYHMEFSLSNSRLAADFIALLARFGIAAKLIERKQKQIVYLKESEAVCDCLALAGAAKTVLMLSSMFVDRYVRQLANRQSNCDLANLDRSVSTGIRQAELFKTIINRLTDPRLVQTAQARINNHEASYDQLAQILGISKGGIKHRLKKLETIAENMQETKNDSQKPHLPL